MEAFVVLGFIGFIVAVIWYVRKTSKTRDKNVALLLKLNEEMGTNFENDGKNPVLVLGSFGYGLVFDTVAKKVLIFTGAGTARVVGYDYFTSWEVTWNVRTRPNCQPEYSKVMLTFETSDLECPLLGIHFVRDKRSAEAWSAKLKILFA